MNLNGVGDAPKQLVIRGVFSEIARIPSWIENLATRFSIPADLQNSINLCLEEVVSNVIRHGYCGEADRSVLVRFSNPRKNYFVFTVEDEAPHFNPLIAPELSELNPREDIRIGGQGIRLLRRFTNALEYEQMPNGNRLSMEFSADGSERPEKP